MKKTERADKIFGTNYKLVIGAFLFLIFAMPMVLFFFEHKSYVEEKRGAVYRIQSKTDEKIQSVKTLLNYTFFDEEFQERLKKIGAGGEQEDYEKISAQLTSMTILGDVIKDVWYFPKAENGGVVESGAGGLFRLSHRLSRRQRGDRQQVCPRREIRAGRIFLLSDPGARAGKTSPPTTRPSGIG